MLPPTIPPLASSFDPLNPPVIFIFLYPVLSIDKRPWDFRSVVAQLQYNHVNSTKQYYHNPGIVF